ncbi:LysM domain-containing protein [Desulfobulbus sp.]|uniref:LysM peptidoglycan-binding domain-containing protein n=1 Tax=Desulfobulbus sp. TaxID=895 RepID=UPI00286FA3D0|nr:LysM domain-containing protein [Desulfobulbus sp.]
MNTTIVATIEALLAAGRVVEAKALLIPEELSATGEELRDCTAEIERRLAQAEALVAQAEALVAQAKAVESEGRIEEAKALYESVLPIAADFPGINEHLGRIDEALDLTRAVQRRGERLRHSRSEGPAKTGKKSRTIWTVVRIGVAIVVLLLAVTMRQPSEPEKKRTEATPPPAPAPHAATGSPLSPAQDRSPPSIAAGNTSPPAATEQPKPHHPPPAPDKPAHDPQPQQLEPPPATADVPQAPQAPEPQPQPEPAEPLPVPATPLPAAAPPTDDQPAELFYTVRRTDSLSSIARNELCDETAWQQIYQLNRDRITDPDQVVPGMSLRLTGLENHCPPPRQPASHAGSPAVEKTGREEKTNH